MVKTTYADPLGVERTWESAERTVRPIPCSVLIVLCAQLVDVRDICITPIAGIRLPAGLPREPSHPTKIRPHLIQEMVTSIGGAPQSREPLQQVA